VEVGPPSCSNAQVVTSAAVHWQAQHGGVGRVVDREA
jgi:hypothetical protein